MKSIIQLLQILSRKDDLESRQLFSALLELDENVSKLDERVNLIEKRNLQYFATVQNSANQTLVNNAEVAFNLTVYPQYGNMHDNTRDNGAIFIRREGVYHICGGIAVTASASGTYRGIVLRVIRDGSAINIASSLVPNTNVGIALSATRSYYCYMHDYIDMIVQHDVGGGVEILTGARTYLSVAERMEELHPNDYGSLDPNSNMRS